MSRRSPTRAPKNSRFTFDFARGDGWYETSIDRHWRVAYRLVRQRGRLKLAELRVFPVETKLPARQPGEWSVTDLGDKAHVPDAGVTTSLLRKLRLREDRNAAARAITETRKHPRIRQAEELSRPGRRGRPPAYWANLAAAYVQACSSSSMRPVEDLAPAYGITASQMRDKIHETRKKGFLTKAPVQGTAGGDLTAKARKVLASGELSVEDLLVLARKQGGIK